MKKITKEEEEDYKKYFIEKGDPGFSPARNKFVVEKTIAKMDKMRQEKHKQWVEGFRERADAVETYLSSRIAQGNTPIEKYFGKRWMSYLRGQKIMKIIKTKKNEITGKIEPKVYLPN
jgi:hypothetical protein